MHAQAESHLWRSYVLTCAGVHAALLADVVVLVPSAASVGEAPAAPHLAVVVPVWKHGPAGAHVGLGPTTLWVRSMYQTVLDEMFEWTNTMEHVPMHKQIPG